MSTLYERLSGNNLGEGSGKIGVHAFLAAVFEYRRGKLTQADVKTMFNLTETQVADSQEFFVVLGLAPNQERMMRVVKDFIYLAESRIDERYSTAAALFSRMQEEVIDQGGLLS